MRIDGSTWAGFNETLLSHTAPQKNRTGDCGSAFFLDVTSLKNLNLRWSQTTHELVRETLTKYNRPPQKKDDTKNKQPCVAATLGHLSSIKRAFIRKKNRKYVEFYFRVNTISYISFCTSWPWNALLSAYVCILKWGHPKRKNRKRPRQRSWVEDSELGRDDWEELEANPPKGRDADILLQATASLSRYMVVL